MARVKGPNGLFLLQSALEEKVRVTVGTEMAPNQSCLSGRDRQLERDILPSPHQPQAVSSLGRGCRVPWHIVCIKVYVERAPSHAATLRSSNIVIKLTILIASVVISIEMTIQKHDD